ncbi:hypothetical protein BC939DRAFT_529932 [Gamsiella multidivaricata]|uniref:uncharacterized protein n=1 Tax=Gamsiella multidivaricata TaxID=101098 RepID=UPI00221EDAB0|nr:uncharacterized protein BC939DRAFT_529932 [Gamsiella multidivaricata]KAI7821761.1 hypothetical protein BC939DRAFT_529932 [Gamsiella multidivaricata]
MARQHRPACFARQVHCSNPQQQRSRTITTTTTMTGRVHKDMFLVSFPCKVALLVFLFFFCPCLMLGALCLVVLLLCLVP